MGDLTAEALREQLERFAACEMRQEFNNLKENLVRELRQFRAEPLDAKKDAACQGQSVWLPQLWNLAAPPAPASCETQPETNGAGAPIVAVPAAKRDGDPTEQRFSAMPMSLHE